MITCMSACEFNKSLTEPLGKTRKRLNTCEFIESLQESFGITESHARINVILEKNAQELFCITVERMHTCEFN